MGQGQSQHQIALSLIEKRLDKLPPNLDQIPTLEKPGNPIKVELECGFILIAKGEHTDGPFYIFREKIQKPIICSTKECVINYLTKKPSIKLDIIGQNLDKLKPNPGFIPNLQKLGNHLKIPYDCGEYIITGKDSKGTYSLFTNKNPNPTIGMDKE